MEVGGHEVQDVSSHAPSSHRPWDDVPTEKEDLRDADSGYDLNPPRNSDIDEDREDKPPKEPETAMPGVHSNDLVILGINPRDMGPSARVPEGARCNFYLKGFRREPFTLLMEETPDGIRLNAGGSVH